MGPLKDQNGELLVEDQKNAELLNEYFSRVFTQEDISNIPEPKNMFKVDSNLKTNRIKGDTKCGIGDWGNWKT